MLNVNLALLHESNWRPSQPRCQVDHNLVLNDIAPCASGRESRLMPVLAVIFTN